MKKDIHALSLLSGGLDSILAAKIIVEEGIRVTGLYFSAPFWSNPEKEDGYIRGICSQIGIDVKIIPVEEDYFRMLFNPPHGWGKHINPCIDCKIYMLRKARALIESGFGDFIVTGEVLGQRPMSQNKSALSVIEKEAGIEGIVVKPLCQKLRPLSIPEEKGWIEREHMYSIEGRTRTTQMKLAEKFGITDYASPAGGCLLTENSYALRLRNLYRMFGKIDWKDAEMCKFGRHFIYGDSLIVVGRNEGDNKGVVASKREDDFIFRVPEYGSPETLLRGEKNDESIKMAARITAFYSACNLKEVTLEYEDPEKKMLVVDNSLTREEIHSHNVSLTGRRAGDT